MRPARAAVAALLLLVASSAAAGEHEACLGPGIGRALQGLVAARAFEGVVPDGYRLTRLDVKLDYLEVAFDDDLGPAATVLLVPTGAAPSQRFQARGPHFGHRLIEARGPTPGPAVDAMLRAAQIVDQAVPSEELRGCKGPPGFEDGPPPRAPAVFGLGVGAAEIAIVLAALVIGVRRRMEE
jgi:hypothetical protein